MKITEKILIAFSKKRNEKGAPLVMVGIALTAILGFSALAVDIGYLVVTRNELQNAADAGALAGARFVYNDSGTSINVGCKNGCGAV